VIAASTALPAGFCRNHAKLLVILAHALSFSLNFVLDKPDFLSGSKSEYITDLFIGWFRLFPSGEKYTSAQL